MNRWRYSIAPVSEDRYAVYDDRRSENVFHGTYAECLMFLGCMCEGMSHEKALAFIKELR